MGQHGGGQIRVLGGGLFDKTLAGGGPGAGGALPGGGGPPLGGGAPPEGGCPRGWGGGGPPLDGGDPPGGDPITDLDFLRLASAAQML